MIKLIPENMVIRGAAFAIGWFCFWTTNNLSGFNTYPGGELHIAREVLVIFSYVGFYVVSAWLLSLAEQGMNKLYVRHPDRKRLLQDGFMVGAVCLAVITLFASIST